MSPRCGSSTMSKTRVRIHFIGYAATALLVVSECTTVDGADRRRPWTFLVVECDRMRFVFSVHVITHSYGYDGRVTEVFLLPFETLVLVRPRVHYDLPFFYESSSSDFLGEAERTSFVRLVHVTC